MRNLAVICALLSIVACATPEPKQATGFTQGTTYSVVYYDDNGVNLQYQIDSILLAFDRVLSTYQESSYISKWNRNELEVTDKQPALFQDVLQRAFEIHNMTNGAFDITVSPLMNFWFDRDWSTAQLDSAQVDSILLYVGMKHVGLHDAQYIKTHPKTQLDVNAIAQGYSVDVLARYLQTEDIYNYLVEIGGEIRTSGTKANQEPWRVGIDLPQENSNTNDSRALAVSVELNNQALATSGNYRKFIEIDGKKYGHSLNPITGYPATTDVLSATVLAADCMTADALATACMVMGVQRSKELINAYEELDAILIYSDANGDLITWDSRSGEEN